jgi:hypothetical protein
MCRMTSLSGGAPIEASSGEGSGAEEKSVIHIGQALLMRISTSGDVSAVERIAANEV